MGPTVADVHEVDVHEVRSMIADVRKEVAKLRTGTQQAHEARALALVVTKLEEAELHLVAVVCGGVDAVEPRVGR